MPPRDLRIGNALSCCWTTIAKRPELPGCLSNPSFRPLRSGRWTRDRIHQPCGCAVFRRLVPHSYEHLKNKKFEPAADNQHAGSMIRSNTVGRQALARPPEESLRYSSVTAWLEAAPSSCLELLQDLLRFRLPPNGIDPDKMNTPAPLPRTSPQVFHGGCLGVSGTPPERSL